MMRLRALLLLALACGPPPAPPAAPLEADDFLLGGIPAWADSGEIRRSFGDPDSTTAAANPFAADPLSIWHYPGFEVRFSAGTPISYLVVQPGEETARGLRVGDPVDELRRRYGAPDALLDSSWTYLEPSPGDFVRILDFVIERDTIRRFYIGPTL